MPPRDIDTSYFLDCHIGPHDPDNRRINGNGGVVTSPPHNHPDHAYGAGALRGLENRAGTGFPWREIEIL